MLARRECWPGGSCSHPGKILSPRTCCHLWSTALHCGCSFTELSETETRASALKTAPSFLPSLPKDCQSRAVLDTQTGLLTSLFMITLPWDWSFPKVSLVYYLVWILTMFGSCVVFSPFLCVSRIDLPKVTQLVSG